MSCDPFLRLLLPSLFPASLIDVFVTGLLNLRTVTCITVLVGPFHPPQDTFHCSLHAADRKELNHAGLACWRCDIRIEIRTSHMWCMQISTTLIQQLESSHPYGGHASWPLLVKKLGITARGAIDPSRNDTNLLQTQTRSQCSGEL